MADKQVGSPPGSYSKSDAIALAWFVGLYALAGLVNGFAQGIAGVDFGPVWTSAINLAVGAAAKGIMQWCSDSEATLKH